ncbi:hypothetical protein [Aeromonas salmonicida]|uniref:hypothetical protein n=1 Tax=Aeromonas salmonicida TaxID=645 RepID=UPI00286698AF|nr:hypothetical protein [Aeromonas salmonicida]MDR7020129.1 hypothetical protein [Aeromonas salmonicida]
MDALIKEIDFNFESFFNETETNINNTLINYDTQKEDFRFSYRRLVSYQAWICEVIEKNACEESLLFFKEAQNDVIMSHALARQGAWRVSLMSLRSCVENTIFGLYYLQHPVELQLWVKGKHKLGFTETINYLSNHPNFEGVDSSISGIEAVKKEYATLSKAVHGSSKLFRMTKTGKIEGLNIVSPPDFGGWVTREAAVLNALNLTFLCFYKDDLTGMANLNLRKTISLAINKNNFPKIKEKLKVNLNKK